MEVLLFVLNAVEEKGEGGFTVKALHVGALLNVYVHQWSPSWGNVLLRKDNTLLLQTLKAIKLLYCSCINCITCILCIYSSSIQRSSVSISVIHK